ncbi:class I SAM-dependent methyltransferase [Methylomonas methanica]|uniref:Methyltransferase type 11 n=1 Tax=Methylomonas methanica (strain DSM 25384 / MC09) TaxID=857087 RepID=F9ZW43_METMM|nr:class I SAM-dependent methyltransferase [Methylomonas methanica]AEG02014.1 Methyltransferase type 11 [Methylomonas methanica MC09]
MNIELAPDIDGCRLCGATSRQREFWREPYLGAGQSLRRCGYCAGLYLAPDFTPASLEDFYAHHYRKLFLTEIIGKHPELFFKHRFESHIAEERLRIASPLLPHDGRLFELGSGFGAFLGALAQARPDIALHASEYDSTHRDSLCAGAKVQWISHFAASPLAGYFDVVAAFHVLEHLPRPTAFSRWAVKALKPGGHLIVEVPDAGCDWRTRKFVHPAHLSYFTADTLRRTLQSAGFQVLNCGPHPAGPAFAGTLLAIARHPLTGARANLISQAEPGEIAAMDRRIDAVRWTLADKLKCHAKHAMATIVGAENTGAFQRWLTYRRIKKLWDS